MDKALEYLTASALRTILVEETKRFIISLEKGTIEELYEKKLRLIYIVDLLKEKEKKEIAWINWGRNATKSEKGIPQSQLASRTN